MSDGQTTRCDLRGGPFRKGPGGGRRSKDSNRRESVGCQQMTVSGDIFGHVLSERTPPSVPREWGRGVDDEEGCGS